MEMLETRLSELEITLEEVKEKSFFTKEVKEANIEFLEKSIALHKRILNLNRNC